MLNTVKENGGLKLFNLKNKEVALKIQGINTYYNNEEIKTLANTMFLHDIKERL